MQIKIGARFWLLASYHAPLFGQPASRIRQTSSVSVARDGHAVILPPALKMVPGRADQTELSSLVVDNALKFKLKIWLAWSREA